MSHAADHRQGAGCHGIDDCFFVKRPQILNAAATATHDKHIDFLPLLRGLNGLGNVLFAACALNGGWVHNYGDVRRAAFERADDIAQCGSGQTGHNADGTRLCRQPALAFFIEKALFLQTRFQAFVALEQPPQAHLAHFVHGDLEFAARTVNADFPQHFDMVAFFERLCQAGGGKFEQGAAHLGLVVFEREIIVPAGGAGQIGNFAADPIACQFGLQQIVGGGVEFGHGEGECGVE